MLNLNQNVKSKLANESDCVCILLNHAYQGTAL